MFKRSIHCLTFVFDKPMLFYDVTQRYWLIIKDVYLDIYIFLGDHSRTKIMPEKIYSLIPNSGCRLCWFLDGVSLVLGNRFSTSLCMWGFRVICGGLFSSLAIISRRKSKKGI